MTDDPEAPQSRAEKLADSYAEIQNVNENQTRTVDRAELEKDWQETLELTNARDVVEQTVLKYSDEIRMYDDQIDACLARAYELRLIYTQHDLAIQSPAVELLGEKLLELGVQTESLRLTRALTVDRLTFLQAKAFVEDWGFPDVPSEHLQRYSKPSAGEPPPPPPADYSGRYFSQPSGTEDESKNQYLEFSDDFHQAHYGNVTFRLNDNQAAFVKDLYELPSGEFKPWGEIFDAIGIDPHQTDFKSPYRLFKRGGKTAFEFYQRFIEHDQGRYRLKRSLP